MPYQVDDVFDTGNTIAAVVKEIAARARDNTPEDIRIAVPWYKPARNETDLVPDYYVRETDEWLVFPHELDSLTPAELRAARPEVAEIVESIKSLAAGAGTACRLARLRTAVDRSTKDASGRSRRSNSGTGSFSCATTSA